jgi:hypothetical protein
VEASFSRLKSSCLVLQPAIVQTGENAERLFLISIAPGVDPTGAENRNLAGTNAERFNVVGSGYGPLQAINPTVGPGNRELGHFTGKRRSDSREGMSALNQTAQFNAAGAQPTRSLTNTRRRGTRVSYSGCLHLRF